MIVQDPLNKEDQKMEPQPQPQNKVEEENQSKSEVSEFYPDYLRYLNEDFQDQTSKVKDRIKKILEFKIKIGPILINQFQNFNFHVREGSISEQILILDVKFGLFQMVIHVLVFDQTSPAHNLNQSESQGTFATIYKTQLFGKKTAIKCHKYKQGMFQYTFHKIVSQYFLLFIASQLQAGPSLNKQCGFDIIVYNHGKESCIEFSMEECLQLNNLKKDQLERNQNSLKEALNRLHFFHIVHFDIKPQNICFSPTYDKQVFIDFGTSDILKENPGYKTKHQQFKGTIAYSGAQMLQIYYHRKSGMVDSYYNDIIGLQKSIQKIAIKNQQFVNDIYEGQFICDKTKEYLMILMKFYLLCQTSQSKNGYNLFIKYKSYILANHISDLFQIIKKRPYSFSANSIYKKIFQSTSIKHRMKYQENIGSYFISNFSGIKSTKEDNVQIPRISKQIINSSLITVSPKIVWNIQALTNIQTISKINKQIYFLNLTRNLRVDEMICSYQEKIHLSTVFMQTYLNIGNQNSAQNIQKSIQYLFDYSFSEQFTVTKQEILQNIITSKNKLLIPFLQLLSAKGDIERKQKILFRFLTAIQWIQYRLKTRYNCQRMQYLMWESTEKFVKLYGNEKQFKILNILVNRRQNQYVNGLFITNKWKMYKDKIIFCPLMLEVQIFILYLSLSSNKYKQYLPQFENKFKVLEHLILQNNHYFKNKFFFISFWAGKRFLSYEQKLKYAEFIQLYKEMFQQYKFYKDFQIFNQNQHFHNKTFYIASNEDKEIKKSLEQWTLVLKQYLPSYILKFQRLNLDIILHLNIQIKNIQTLDLLKFNKMYLKQSLLSNIQGNHTFEYFYRGHLLNTKIRQHFDHILNYYFLKRKFISDKYSKEAVNNQLIQCVQQFYYYCAQLLSKIQCFKCKILSLVQLNRVQIIRMHLCRNPKNALSTQICLLSAIIKNSELRKLRLQICESIIKFSYDEPQQLMLIHQYLKLTSNFSQYLTTEFINILPYVYILHFRRGDFLELSELIKELSQQLLNKYNRSQIINYMRFLNQIYMLIQLAKQQQYFFEKNVQMIEKWKKYNNPYLALYYSIILRTRTQSHFRSFIISFITFSLQILDPISRQYILYNYYSQILNNFEPKSRRKYHYLNKMHYKHKQKKQGISTYLRQLGQNITNNRWQVRSNIRYKKYKKYLIRYHQNIQNLIE